MNKRQQKILDDLAIVANDLDVLERVMTRRTALWKRGYAAGLSTSDLATASRVQPVTVRKWKRR